MLHSIVKNSFKMVMVAIVGFIIVGVSTYVVRAYALNTKLESLQSLLQNEVCRNNYLSSDSYEVYKNIMKSIEDSDPKFIEKVEINWGSDARDVDNYSVPSGASRDLQEISQYGDTKVIQIHVRVKKHVWGSERSDGAIGKASDLMSGWKYGDWYRSIEVPCLRYVK